ncbi:MAG: hypothetical protein JKX84_08400 [Flavobacteriales bacterium]|nr:hypothetical protein [Flavobacteriales bacterium]
MKIETSKLILLLKALGSDEFKQLNDFVRSPFHNKNTKVIQLLEALHGHYPKFSSEQLTREALHARIFVDRPFNDLDIRRSMSQLALVVESFLGWSNMMQRPTELRVAQLRAFRKKGLQKHFVKSAKEATLMLETQQQSLHQHYQQFCILQERESFEEQFGGRRSETRLQQVSDHLDTFYMASKLKQSCAVVSYEQVFKHRYHIDLTTEVLQLLENKTVESPLVNLYRFGLLTMSEPENESHFINLKKLLQNSPDMEPSEERNIHVLGQNYCIRNMNRGRSEYINELFELYKLGLEKQVIQSDLSQFPPAFKNIVSTGLKVKQFDWVEKFIHNYSDLIPKADRSDFRNFNLSRLRFDQGRFIEVKQLLQEVRFKDVFITLNARILLIKTFYELDEWDVLEHQIKSFKGFISRQKKLSYHANIFMDNVRFISKLVRLNHNKKADVEKLTAEVNGEKTLTEKSWILSKLTEVIW